MIFSDIFRRQLPKTIGMLARPSSTRGLQEQIIIEISPIEAAKRKELFQKMKTLVDQGFYRFSITTPGPLVSLNFLKDFKNHYPMVEVLQHVASSHLTAESAAVTMNALQDFNVNNVLVIRGDSQQSSVPSETLGALTVIKLVEQMSREGFACYAACYPERHPKCKTDAENFQNIRDKQSAGVAGLISQSVFDENIFSHFCNELAFQNIKLPVYPNVMLSMNPIWLDKFAKKIGVTVPHLLLNKITEKDTELYKAKKLEFYGRLISRLLAHNTPIHCSVLNNFTLFLQVLKHIKLPERKMLRR